MGGPGPCKHSVSYIQLSLGCSRDVCKCLVCMVPLAFRLQVGCPRASRNMLFCMVPSVRVNDFPSTTTLKALLTQTKLMVFTVPLQSGGPQPRLEMSRVDRASNLQAPCN